MRDIHGSPTTWFPRRPGRGSAARPSHRSHRRRFTLEPLEGRALLSLTTWLVNDPGDTGAGSGNSGDLRYVLTQSNQTEGDNTINFAVTGTITLNSALPDLSNTTGLMDIEGPGAASLTIARSSDSNTPQFRIFDVDPGAQVTMVGLTIKGGSVAESGGGIANAGILSITDSVISSNLAGPRGGGIANSGTLTLSQCRITGNSLQNGGDWLTDGGGGIYNASSSVTDIHTCTIDYNMTLNVGGGVDNLGALTLSNSTLRGNSAAFDGAGVCNLGQATLMDSMVQANSAGAYGGGISNSNGAVSLAVQRCTLDSNAANEGGGISSFESLIVTDCSITANSAGDGGGGIIGFSSTTVEGSTFAGNSAVDGGGILSLGSCAVSGVTITANLAMRGGGILNDGAMSLSSCTISNNSAQSDVAWGGGLGNLGTISINNSTISGNSAPSGGGIVNGSYVSYAQAGTMIVTNSIITGNSAYWFEGGGILNSIGTVTVTDSTLDHNSAGHDGGGIHSYETVILTNSTIAFNSAGSSGGGIRNNGGTLTVTNSTIAYNSCPHWRRSPRRVFRPDHPGQYDRRPQHLRRHHIPAISDWNTMARSPVRTT